MLVWKKRKMMNNDRVIRIAIYAYIIPLFIGLLIPFDDMELLLGGKYAPPLELFNVDVAIGEKAIRYQIHAAFSHISNMAFFLPLIIWLIGFSIQIKYYRLSTESTMSVGVILGPLLLFCITLAIVTIDGYLIIEQEVRTYVNTQIMHLGYCYITISIMLASIPYLLSTAIMAIFYRRKGDDESSLE